MSLHRGQAPTAPAGDTQAESVWTASTFVAAEPSEVLAALTDPERIARWAPVAFDIEQVDGERLRPGSHARVNGTLAGLGAGFEVEVSRADEQGLELLARGPVVLDVAYRFFGCGEGVVVQARVALRRRRGLTAQLLRVATAALLNSGALGGALGRLGGELDRRPDRHLVAV